eukprot:15431064-Alexandrium_andersonii.AAC.1
MPIGDRSQMRPIHHRCGCCLGAEGSSICSRQRRCRARRVGCLGACAARSLRSPGGCPLRGVCRCSSVARARQLPPWA